MPPAPRYPLLESCEQQTSRLRAMHAAWREAGGDQGDFLDTVAREFGWTRGQAYIATEFLFRPENHN